MNKLFARSIAVSTFTVVLTTTVFTSIFINKAEASHCGFLDFTGNCIHENTGSEIGGGLVENPRPTSEDLTRQLYKSILGRNPDPSGFRDNVNAMKQNGFEWVRAGIAGSQESRNNINNLYRQYLCRNAESGGMDHHINLLASGQMTLAQIRRGISTGAEAKQHPNGCR